MSKQTIRIDLVSDVVCPWCVIGYKQLEKALELLEEDVTADIHWHPFELNPRMSQAGQNLRDHLAEKYGTTLRASIRARATITQLGAELGFTFNFHDDMKIYNTFQAHQLLHLARGQGKETELKLRLFTAYFSEGKMLNQVDVLVEEAVKIGLDAEQCRTALTDGQYADAVRQEAQTWLARGVTGVPMFVFNHRYAVSGAQSPETLVDVIRQAANLTLAADDQPSVRP